MTIIRPKKSLGQHFLKDLGIAQRIAETLAAYRGLPVLEVGPGTGVLTQFLLGAGHDLTVVEIDHASIDYLRTHFSALNGRIIRGDFLAMHLERLYDSPFCVIGNYPARGDPGGARRAPEARRQIGRASCRERV